MTRAKRLFVIVVLLATPVSASYAAPAGQVTEVRGDGAIESDGGSRQPIQPGATLAVGDKVSTADTGRTRLLLSDGSLLSLAGNTELQIIEQTGTGTTSPRTALSLSRGRVLIAVGEGFRSAGSEYRVETKTAITKVTGTEFVITYDAVEDVTDLIGLSGSVQVNSVIDLLSRGVVVKAREQTIVKRGELPTRPDPIEETVFRQYMEDLQFVGLTRPAASALAKPLVTADDIDEPDDSTISNPWRDRVQQVDGIEQPVDSLGTTGNVDIEL